MNLVLSPHALIRYRGPKILIHTSLRREYLIFEKPAILTLLDYFATPKAANPPPEIQGMAPREVRNHLYSLVRIHVLVKASTEPLQDDAAVRTQNVQRAYTHLCSIANAIYEISNDVLAFGPWGDADVEHDTGLGVADRMEAILAAVDALRAELVRRRSAYVECQLQALHLPDQPRDLKLNIGAGQHSLQGWINVDVFPAELAVNLSWGLPFPAGSAEYIYMSHVLEHLYYPDEALGVLKETHRVLKEGGVLRVIVPDIEKCIRAYVAADDDFFASRKESWTWWPKSETRLEDFLAYAGAGTQPSSFFDRHKYGYDYETLENLLRKAGFHAVSRSEYMQSPHTTLRIDHGTTVAGAKYRNEYYSLFVEARR